jgi:hypothetical protein
MAITVANRLDADNEERMCEFAATLTEKDRRRFAAFEAKQQGYGGIEYIAGIIGCSRRTIERGIEELDHLDQDPAAGQVRRPGAGRKKRLARTQKSNGT